MGKRIFALIHQMMAKENNEKVIKYLITAMFVLLPVIDILRVSSIRNVEIFNISILEIVNLLLIGISFLLTVPKIKVKHKKYLILYFIFVLVFMIFHVINTYKFDVSLLPTARHNYIIEIYYMVRVYILPLLLMIVLFENKHIFNRKYYLNLMKYFVIIISGQVVILNLFRYSYSTYMKDLTNYAINRSNFLDVFVYEKNFKTLLTVGLFPSANQISLVLFMILPLNIYNLYLEPKFKNVLLVILQVLSMIVIGTKVAALGNIFVLLATLIMYIFFLVIKKEKINYNYLIAHMICIIVSIGVIYISPFMKVYKNGFNTGDFSNDVSVEEINAIRSKVNYDLSSEELSEILYNNPSAFKISTIFYDLYPINIDKEFWIEMALRDRKLNNDYRVLKNDIMKRVMVRNNNKLDKYLGMGYTIDSIDMEKDYVYQYYLFGILGLFLFIGLYIFFYFYNILKIFKKNYFNYNFCICLVPSFLGLVACYFSGHLFGWTSPMIILAMTLCIGRVNS